MGHPREVERAPRRSSGRSAKRLIAVGTLVLAPALILTLTIPAYGQSDGISVGVGPVTVDVPVPDVLDAPSTEEPPTPPTPPPASPSSPDPSTEPEPSAPPTTAPPTTTPPPPVAAPSGPSAPYVVQLDPGTNAQAAAFGEAVRGNPVDEVYDTAIDGFAAQLDPGDVVRLAADPAVVSIEPDQIMTFTTTEPSSSWGLDRIDQRALPLDSAYSYDATAANVDAYIVDTGVRADHIDFGGRVVPGFDAINSPPVSDCHGHGTHVAGTVAGARYGVAKAARIVPVRVLNCQGSGLMSGVIAGLDWIVEQHVSGHPAVANMSLGGNPSTSLDNAVGRAALDGIVVVVAAGNDNRSACDASPARAPDAITVGSTTSTDQRSGFSNFGTCVDLFAPGSGIQSDYSTSATATATMSGTSMASPHVAGVAALVLARTPGASASAVTAEVIGTATSSVVGNAGAGSPDLLLHSRLAPLVPATPTPPPPPTPAPRPDALIRRSADPRFVGNNVYRALGAGQTVQQRVSPGVKAKAFVKIENDGALPETFRVRGTAGTSRVTVRYYSGIRDVTAQVVAGTFELSGVAPGTNRQLQVVATVARAAPANTRKNVYVVVRSTRASVSDTVLAVAVAA